MADLATLGLRVESGEVIKATASLDSMTVAGTKTEAAAQRLTRRMALLEIEARNVDAAMGQMHPRVTQLAGAFAALAAVAAAFVFHELIKNTIEAQNAMAQLEAAVKSTGGVAGRSVEQLDDFSMAMQRTTVYSDEAVKGVQSVLLTFDKIRGQEFDRTTQAVADLAARMGGDLQGAAVQLGKALQDPTTGLTALRRSGVSFSESQIELIKTLYETGRVAEGQTVILKEMEHQFGGSAAAARDTLGGALSHLKNVFGDLFEVTRNESSALVSFINTIGDAIQKVGEYREVIKSTGDALAITGAGVGTFVLALKASEIGLAAFAAAAAPILVLAAAFSVLVVAVENAREEMRQAQDAEDELTKSGADHLAYLKALGVAHAHAPAAAVKPVEDETAAILKLTGGMTVELQKLTALNAAHDQSALALKLITIEYDRRAEHVKNAIGHTQQETAALNALSDAMTAQKVIAAQLGEAERQRAEDASDAEARWAEMARQGEIAHGKLAEKADQLKTTLAGVAGEVERIRTTFTALEHDQGSGVAKEILATAVAAKTLAEEMQRHFSDAFVNIATKGIQSFRDFFASIRDMFLRMAADLAAAKLMEKLTKSGADGGSSIIGSIAGSLGGFGGVAIAGLAAAATSLFGAGRAHKEAAAALQRAADALNMDIATYVTGAGGDGRAAQILSENQRYKELYDRLKEFFDRDHSMTAETAARYAVQFRDLATAHQHYLEEIDKAAEATKALAEAEAVAAARAAQRAREDLDVRHLAATGGDASGAAFRNQQQREYEDAKLAGKSEEYLHFLTQVQVEEAIQRAQTQEIEKQTGIIQNAANAAQAAFDAQQKTAEDALRVAEDQLREQERAVEATRRVIDSLKDYAAGLSLNTSLTTLSPAQQVIEARRQFEELLQKAQGGDRDAAGNLGGAGSAFLTASRAYNASGAAYVQDFRRVQDAVRTIQDQYGTQLTTEEKILAQLQSQTTALQAQIQAIQDAAAQAAADAAAQIAAFQDTASAQSEQIHILQRVLEFLNDPNQGHGVDNTGGNGAPSLDNYVTIGSFDSTITGLSNRIDLSADRSYDAAQDAVVDRLETVIAELRAGNDSRDYQIAVLQDAYGQMLQRLDSIDSRVDDGNRINKNGYQELAAI